MSRNLFAAALFCLPLCAVADPPAGSLDPTFADNGQAHQEFVPGGSADRAYAMIEDAESHLILAGIGDVLGPGECIGLMRFSPDGDLDETGFGTNGKTCHAPALGASYKLGFDLELKELPDGKIAVAGTALNDGLAQSYVCRFLQNGVIDETFGTDEDPGCQLLPQDAAQNISVAPTILVRGQYMLVVSNHDVGDVITPIVNRIKLADGSIELFGQQAFLPLFFVGQEFDAIVHDAALTEEGDVISVGQYQSGGDSDFFVARFDPVQGEPSTGFGEAGVMTVDIELVPFASDKATAVTMLPDGNILVAGTSSAPPSAAIGIVSLAAETGTISSTFNGGMPALYSPPPCVQSQCAMRVSVIERSNAGMLVIGGSIRLPVETLTGLFAARLHANATPDSTFGNGGHSAFFSNSSGEIGSMGMVLQGERILLGGSLPDVVIARLSDGRLFNDEFEDIP